MAVRMQHQLRDGDVFNPETDVLMSVAYPQQPGAPYPWRDIDVVRTSHVGLVLDIFERNGYDDSDFIAVVWDIDAGQPKHVEYATTRGWTYANSATVDATPVVQQLYAAWQKRQRQLAAAAAADVEAHMPRIGRMAIVTGGRKHLGKYGVIRWTGGAFGSNRNQGRDLLKAFGIMTIGLQCRDHRTRVGIDVEGEGRIFVNCDKIDVIAELDDEQIVDDSIDAAVDAAEKSNSAAIDESRWTAENVERVFDFSVDGSVLDDDCASGLTDQEWALMQESGAEADWLDRMEEREDRRLIDMGVY